MSETLRIKEAREVLDQYNSPNCLMIDSGNLNFACTVFSQALDLAIEHISQWCYCHDRSCDHCKILKRFGVEQ